MKRPDYISWENYFMGIAILSSKRSKDPVSQVGSCIVGKNKRIIGIGFNGMVRTCGNNDDEFSWEKGNLDPLQNKYLYVVHSEENAILSCNSNELEGSTIFTTLFPCNKCAQTIIQVGIKEVVYLNNKYKNKDFTIAAAKMFNAARIRYSQFISTGKSITIDFEDFE
jgi:dCMP deaminase